MGGRRNVACSLVEKLSNLRVRTIGKQNIFCIQKDFNKQNENPNPLSLIGIVTHAGYSLVINKCKQIYSHNTLFYTYKYKT